MRKTETKRTVLLKHQLKALKLPTMTAECEEVLRGDLGDHVLESLDLHLAALLLGVGSTPLVLEDAGGRAQQLLLPGVILGRVEPLATA
jgi:hypothetical protein